MTTELVQRADIQSLLDRVSGKDQKGGNPRLKPIMRDLVESVFTILDEHKVNETEFWQAMSYLAETGPEIGLIIPGIGIEHFNDVLLDEADKKAGLDDIGTPRTIEGPLYVKGAPTVKSEAVMSDAPDKGENLVMHGIVRDLQGNVIPNATVEVWHADTRGFYSHFDPTEKQGAFNNRRTIETGADGAYKFKSIMPSGYAVPPGGTTERLLDALGRHGKRPAHIHFFVTADGFRHLTTQINIADDPLVYDDFAFATREELIPAINRDGDGAVIEFNFAMVPVDAGSEYALSERSRLEG